MNVERLHAIIRALREDLDRTGQAATLQELIGAVSNMANQAQSPEYQQQASQARAKIQELLNKTAVDTWSAAWQEVLQELGIRDLFGAEFAEQVEASFNANEVTPATIASDVQPLLDRLNALNDEINHLLTAFDSLGIGHEKLSPGQVA